MITLALTIFTIYGLILISNRFMDSWVYIFAFPVVMYKIMLDNDYQKDEINEIFLWNFLVPIIQSVFVAIPFVGWIGSPIVTYYLRKKYMTEFYDTFCYEYDAEYNELLFCLFPTLLMCITAVKNK